MSAILKIRWDIYMKCDCFLKLVTIFPFVKALVWLFERRFYSQKTKKINIFMKKFHIPIGQWQKYGWKWEIAIGLCNGNATMGVAYFIYVKHMRDSSANGTTLNVFHKLN